MTGVGVGVRERPRLRLGAREVPVVLPSAGDPRLHLAVVLLTVQVLGQTVLDFKLSIAQILITIGVCAAVETGMLLRREGALVWPASAMLTGNSIALLLRTTGTQHGDWWSLNGIGWFVLAALLAMGSKYLLRPGGSHLFNPSNVALVWVLLVAGATEVFPQYLWWGPFDSAPVIAALAVILVGAVWVLRPIGMLPMAGAFLVPFGVLIGIFAASGRSFHAVWASGPVSGWSYAVDILASPELLIFVFFMMSDPVTAPRSRRGRLIYGAVVALVAAGLTYPQPTEFGVKLAILSSLTVVCAVVPAIDRLGRRIGAEHPVADLSVGWAAVWSRTREALRRPVVVAVAIIALGALVDTARLADDPHLLLLEQGLTPEGNPQ